MEDAENSLTVTVNGSSSATAGGVTVSGIAVDSSGNVTADVSAGCGATNASFTLKVTDSGNQMSTAALNVTVTNETTPPVINPIANVVVTLPSNYNGSTIAVNFPLPSASDNCGSVNVMTDPVSGSQFPVGTTTVNVTATDAAGNQSFATFTVTVRYQFKFFDYSDLLSNPQYFIQATAGSNVAVRFSLSGFQGDPYSQAPTSQQISCTTKAPIGGAQIIDRFAPDPYYSSLYDFYQTTWRTQASWKFTCRRLTLYLKDGSTRSLDFFFK